LEPVINAREKDDECVYEISFIKSVNNIMVGIMSQVSHTTIEGRATTSDVYCWPMSIRCARPHGLELLAGRPPCTAGL